MTKCAGNARLSKILVDVIEYHESKAWPISPRGVRSIYVVVPSSDFCTLAGFVIPIEIPYICRLRIHIERFNALAGYHAGVAAI